MKSPTSPQSAAERSWSRSRTSLSRIPAKRLKLGGQERIQMAAPGRRAQLDLASWSRARLKVKLRQYCTSWRRLSTSGGRIPQARCIFAVAGVALGRVARVEPDIAQAELPAPILNSRRRCERRPQRELEAASWNRRRLPWASSGRGLVGSPALFDQSLQGTGLCGSRQGAASELKTLLVDFPGLTKAHPERRYREPPILRRWTGSSKKD